MHFVYHYTIVTTTITHPVTSGGVAQNLPHRCRGEGNQRVYLGSVLQDRCGLDGSAYSRPAVRDNTVPAGEGSVGNVSAGFYVALRDTAPRRPRYSSYLRCSRCAADRSLAVGSAAYSTI